MSANAKPAAPLALPEGFTARPPTFGDLEEVLHLFNTCAAEVGPHDRMTPDALRGEWEDSDWNMEEEGIVVLAPDGKIVGWAEYYDRLGHVKIDCRVGTVLPEFRGQGLEEELLAWVERGARRHAALAGPQHDVWLFCGVVDTDRYRCELLERTGFEIGRWFTSLEIDLDDSIGEPAWPEGIELREMIPGRDERSHFAVKRESFADHWGTIDLDFEEEYERFLEWTKVMVGYDPSLFRAAWDDEEIAGICWTFPEHDGNREEAYLSHLGVRRPWRGRGIAKALMLDAFRECRRRGLKTVSLGVDAENDTGAIDLYEKVGMRTRRRIRLYTKIIRPAAAGEKEGTER